MMSRRTASLHLGVAVILPARARQRSSRPERPPVVTNHQIVDQRPPARLHRRGRTRSPFEMSKQASRTPTCSTRRIASPRRASHDPCTFIWNGGPGWPALPLHFEVAGPLRGEGDRLVDNADTWLTESDLVFIDPVGTGFSRATKPEYVKEFALLVGDVMAEAEFIRSWLLLHDAEEAPVIVAGESYGSSRAGRVGYAVLKRGFNVAGIVLISGGTDLPTFENSNTRGLGDARRRHGGRRAVLQEDAAGAGIDAGRGAHGDREVGARTVSARRPSRRQPVGSGAKPDRRWSCRPTRDTTPIVSIERS